MLPPGVKWTEPITHALGKLQDACAKYIGQHLSCVLTSGTLLHLTQDELWDIGSVESILLGAGSKLSPDEACRVYVQLDVMLHHTPQPTWHQVRHIILVVVSLLVALDDEHRAKIISTLSAFEPQFLLCKSSVITQV